MILGVDPTLITVLVILGIILAVLAIIYFLRRA